MGRTRRAGVVGALLLALAAATVGALAPSAQAAESWAWPASGTLTTYGHGFGHGHGMSQYGAYGAATKGLTSSQILAFYYKGTTLATKTDVALRVLITGDTDQDTRVAPVTGLVAATADGTVTLPTASGGVTIALWRAVRPTSAGTELQYLTGGSWKVFAVGGKTAHTGPITFSATGGLVRLVIGSTYREYRGSVRGAPSGAAPGLRSVVLTSMDSYLRSVVPSEMPSSWPAAALQSQAVAARTYATWGFDHAAAGAIYDTCDSTACQVFKGRADYTSSGTLITTHEATSSTNAVAATVNRLVTYGGAAAFTQFSSSNGGYAAAGSQPYLAAFPDPYDGVVASTAHSWTTTVAASTLQSAYPSIGTLRSVSLSRDGHGEWGGRVTSITLVGSAGSVTITGDQFRSATGMRSTWWAPASTGWAAYNLVLGPGDWNGDGHVDLIARRPDGSLVLTAGLTGGTAPAQTIGSGWNGSTAVVAPGDWDGDGHPDLLSRRADGSLWLYRGSGSGGFLTWRQIGSGWGGFTAIVGAGDWDGDGHPDLLARRGSDGALVLYRGSGTGGWLGSRVIGSGWGGFTAVLGPGDWSGDGHPDVLARRSDGSLVLYRGSGTGGWLTSTVIGAGWNGFSVIATPGDWTGDGHPDLVARNSAGLWLYPNAGAGSFAARSQLGAS